ncbi:dirigent protein 10 [Eucalyptus grandis]|uniref:dirigent protein 10 n=1 Tax=Eucalyptus grandis TaxID=71139 RepID=UPI000523FB40|nr:dirigent protein 10 [Eucalyptus grandis]
MASPKIAFVQHKCAAFLLLWALTIQCVACSRALSEDATSVPAFTPPLPTPAQALTNPSAPVAASTATGPASTGSNTDLHPMLFYMHDILGGSSPTARAVTGIVTNPALSAQVPFAKPNGANLPINSGIPQNSANTGLINNNNVPFLTGLGGNTGNVLQNNGGNNGANLINGGPGFPILNGGQLPQGMTIQKLMFGTLTVFDDELTEGHELGSGLVGKAQGFYVASSEDGNSQTITFTAMFESGGYIDSISFFGVHRTAVSQSQLAIMGGTGKYVNARGYATVKTFAASNQHDTDGMETVLEFTVYLA